eukprot:11534722-Alexandrium_andersonii.AAC.1
MRFGAFRLAPVAGTRLKFRTWVAEALQFGVSRETGRLPRANASWGEASPLLQRPFRALSGPPPDGH